jgi:hypothetical protein
VLPAFARCVLIIIGLFSFGRRDPLEIKSKPTKERIMTSIEIKTDCVALVDEYLELNPAPLCCKEITMAVKAIIADYSLSAAEYVGALAYEIEYRTGIIC